MKEYVLKINKKPCWQRVPEKADTLHIVRADSSFYNVLFSHMLHFLGRLRISDFLGDLVPAERGSVERVNICK